MRVTETEHHRALALHFGAIADADDFQVPSPSFGDAFDGVVDQGAGQTMDSGLGIIFAHRQEMPVLLLYFDSRGQLRVQLALRTLHGNRVALDFDRNSLRERDRFLSNS